MTKAFLFDMDGVLANTENAWMKEGYDQMVINHFGRDLWERVPVSGGMSFEGIFNAYAEAGFVGQYEDFYQKAVKIAERIYPVIDLTPGVDDLIVYLKSQGYVVGIVSSSPREWINMLATRLQTHDQIDIKVSVNKHPTLKPKPAPDPYRYAMQELGVSPGSTWILEDSSIGIKAGKASGARVICFTAYRPVGEIPGGADYSAASMVEVKEIVAKLDRP